MRWMSEQIPYGRYLRCSGGHLAQYDDPEHFFTGLVDFLQSLCPHRVFARHSRLAAFAGIRETPELKALSGLPDSSITRDLAVVLCGRSCSCWRLTAAQIRPYGTRPRRQRRRAANDDIWPVLRAGLWAWGRVRRDDISNRASSTSCERAWEQRLQRCSGTLKHVNQPNHGEDRRCVLCGDTGATVEHIIPQTLWVHWGLDPDGVETERFRTRLCEGSNAAGSALHAREDVLALIRSGTAAQPSTFARLADWAVWVTMLIGITGRASVWPRDDALLLLRRRLPCAQAHTLPVMYRGALASTRRSPRRLRWNVRASATRSRFGKILALLSDQMPAQSAGGRWKASRSPRAQRCKSALWCF
jgi:hypothetical protein